MENDNIEYIEAYAQLKTIVNMMPEELKAKIPNEYIQELNKYTVKNYIFKYDFNKPLNEQSLNDITREVISDIYLHYFCDEKEKNEYEIKVQNKIDDNRKINDVYCMDIFNGNKDKKEKLQENGQSLAKIKQENIIINFIKKIKKLFSE